MFSSPPDGTPESLGFRTLHFQYKTPLVVLLFIRSPVDAYSLVYWRGEGTAVLLGLGVIVEVIWHLIRPYPFLRKFTLQFFRIVALAALAAGIIMHLSTENLGQTDPILEAIILLERSARFLQACLLIVLILLRSRPSLTWQYYAIGIAAGFGVYSAVDLVLLELRAHLHLITNDILPCRSLRPTIPLC